MQLSVEIQYCVNCYQHSWCSQHDENKYLFHFEKIRDAVLQRVQLGDDILVRQMEAPKHYQKLNANPQDNKYYDIRRNEEVYFPRLSAFEVYVDQVLIFSKLKSISWPNDEKVADMIMEMNQSKRDGKQLHVFQVGYTKDGEDKNKPTKTNFRKRQLQAKTPQKDIDVRHSLAQSNDLSLLNQRYAQEDLSNPKEQDKKIIFNPGNAADDINNQKNSKNYHQIYSSAIDQMKETVRKEKMREKRNKLKRLQDNIVLEGYGERYPIVQQFNELAISPGRSKQKSKSKSIKNAVKEAVKEAMKQVARQAAIKQARAKDIQAAKEALKPSLEVKSKKRQHKVNQSWDESKNQQAIRFKAKPIDKQLEEEWNLLDIIDPKQFNEQQKQKLLKNQNKGQPTSESKLKEQKQKVETLLDALKREQKAYMNKLDYYNQKLGVPNKQDNKNMMKTIQEEQPTERRRQQNELPPIKGDYNTIDVVGDRKTSEKEKSQHVVPKTAGQKYRSGGKGEHSDVSRQSDREENKTVQLNSSQSKGRRQLIDSKDNTSEPHRENYLVNDHSLQPEKKDQLKIIEVTKQQKHAKKLSAVKQVLDVSLGKQHDQMKSDKLLPQIRRPKSKRKLMQKQVFNQTISFHTKEDTKLKPKSISDMFAEELDNDAKKEGKVKKLEDSKQTSQKNDVKDLKKGSSKTINPLANEKKQKPAVSPSKRTTIETAVQSEEVVKIIEPKVEAKPIPSIVVETQTDEPLPKPKTTIVQQTQTDLQKSVHKSLIVEQTQTDPVKPKQKEAAVIQTQTDLPPPEIKPQKVKIDQQIQTQRMKTEEKVKENEKTKVNIPIEQPAKVDKKEKVQRIKTEEKVKGQTVNNRSEQKKVEDKKSKPSKETLLSPHKIEKVKTEQAKRQSKTADKTSTISKPQQAVEKPRQQRATQKSTYQLAKSNKKDEELSKSKAQEAPKVQKMRSSGHQEKPKQQIKIQKLQQTKSLDQKTPQKEEKPKEKIADVTPLIHNIELKKTNTQQSHIQHKIGEQNNMVQGELKGPKNDGSIKQPEKSGAYTSLIIESHKSETKTVEVRATPPQPIKQQQTKHNSSKQSEKVERGTTTEHHDKLDRQERHEKGNRVSNDSQQYQRRHHREDNDRYDHDRHDDRDYDHRHDSRDQRRNSYRQYGRDRDYHRNNDYDRDRKFDRERRDRRDRDYERERQYERDRDYDRDYDRYYQDRSHSRGRRHDSRDRDRHSSHSPYNYPYPYPPYPPYFHRSHPDQSLQTSNLHPPQPSMQSASPSPQPVHVEVKLEQINVKVDLKMIKDGEKPVKLQLKSGFNDKQLKSLEVESSNKKKERVEENVRKNQQKEMTNDSPKKYGIVQNMRRIKTESNMSPQSPSKRQSSSKISPQQSALGLKSPSKQQKQMKSFDRITLSIDKSKLLNNFLDCFEYLDNKITKITGDGSWHCIRSKEVLPSTGRYSFGINILSSQMNCIQIGIMPQDYLPIQNQICDKALGFHYANGKIHDTKGVKDKKTTAWRVVCNTAKKGKVAIIQLQVDADNQSVIWKKNGKPFAESILTNYLKCKKCVAYISMVHKNDAVELNPKPVKYAERNNSEISQRYRNGSPVKQLSIESKLSLEKSLSRSDMKSPLKSQIKGQNTPKLQNNPSKKEASLQKTEKVSMKTLQHNALSEKSQAKDTDNKITQRQTGSIAQGKKQKVKEPSPPVKEDVTQQNKETPKFNKIQTKQEVKSNNSIFAEAKLPLQLPKKPQVKDTKEPKTETKVTTEQKKPKPSEAPSDSKMNSSPTKEEPTLISQTSLSNNSPIKEKSADVDKAQTRQKKDEKSSKIVPVNPRIALLAMTDKSFNIFYDNYSYQPNTIKKATGDGFWHCLKLDPILPRAGKFSFGINIISSSMNCIQIGIMPKDFIPIQNKICDKSIGFHFANGKIHDTNGVKDKKTTAWRAVAEPTKKGDVGMIDVEVDSDNQSIIWKMNGKPFAESTLTNYLKAKKCVAYISMVHKNDTVVLNPEPAIRQQSKTNKTELSLQKQEVHLQSGIEKEVKPQLKPETRDNNKQETLKKVENPSSKPDSHQPAQKTENQRVLTPTFPSADPPKQENKQKKAESVKQAPEQSIPSPNRPQNNLQAGNIKKQKVSSSVIVSEASNLHPIPNNQQISHVQSINPASPNQPAHQSNFKQIYHNIPANPTNLTPPKIAPSNPIPDSPHPL